jgi:hypothetical protein
MNELHDGIHSRRDAKNMPMAKFTPSGRGRQASEIEAGGNLTNPIGKNAHHRDYGTDGRVESSRPGE